MDEDYLQTLIDWMDGDDGYRAWHSAQADDSGGNSPPPPPPNPGFGD